MLGTFVEIAADREDAIEAAFEAVAQVHGLMSAHAPDSDVSCVNRYGHRRAVEVHQWTALVLERSLHWARESAGAFDPLRAGSAAVRLKLFPCHEDQPRPIVDHWTWLELHGRSVRLMKPACIDLGGIAKGFAVDRAADVLRGFGCERGLINAGGDLRGFGARPWPVTIVDPRRRRAAVEVQIADQALATSAGLRTDITLDFRHLGGASRRWTSVSVLADTACDADALTKLVWAGCDRLSPALTSIGAKALGITDAGTVESIGQAQEVMT